MASGQTSTSDHYTMNNISLKFVVATTDILETPVHDTNMKRKHDTKIHTSSSCREFTFKYMKH